MPPAPGMMPSLTSGWPNRAPSPATMMSACMANSQPPPSANPFTAAMTGLGTMPDRGPIQVIAALHHLPRAAIDHGSNVRPCGECVGIARQHDHPRVRVCAKTDEYTPKFRAKVRAQGIA